MKEVKAFIRSAKAESVLQALEDLGVADITLIDVMGLGHHLVDPEQSRYSIDIVKRYSDIAKIEIVCKAEDVDRIVQTIRDTAYTGMPGDGLVFVTNVEQVIKIRTGEVGKEAL